jgi:hypothetical protein
MTVDEHERFQQSLDRLREEGRPEKDSRILALREHEANQKAERDWQAVESGEPTPAQGAEMGKLRCPRCHEVKERAEFRGNICYRCKTRPDSGMPPPVRMALPW